MGFVKSGRDARGFSTVELMVTILLVGILAAIVVPKMLGPRTEAKNTEAKSSLQTGFAAARSYLADNRSYANLCANESTSCNNKISLHALSQQIPNSELRGDASPRDSLDARPGALWMGSSTVPATDNGVDPDQNTLVLCSLTEGGDTIFCIKDDKGVISYAKVVDENQTVNEVVANASNFKTNTDLNGNAIASTTADDAPADANVDSAPVNKTLPVVTASDGTAVGDQLTGSPGSWSGNPIPTYSFSWKRCNSSGESCQFIAGADNSVYTLVTGDIGSRLKLSVLAENSVAPEATAESLPSSLVEEPASTQSSPSNTSDPYISGQTIVGSTLVVNPGQWSGSPDPEFSYTWRRCDFSGSNCIAISGATGSSYLLEGLDASTTIRVRVTASNSEGSSSVITAARGPISSLPVNVVSPSITGSIVRGELLAADPGSWSGYPEPTYAFQWQRCDSAGANCQSIDGQTESSYTVSAGDTGRTLRLKTIASNVAGSVSAYSAPTSGVQGTPENTTAPSISGSAVMDQTLTASEGSWTGTPSPSYSYQWQRCDIDGTNCSNIISASDNTYKVQRVDGAKRLQVRVTAQNTNGASSSTSDQTSAAKTPPLNLNRPVLSGSVAMDEQLSTTDGSWDGYEASTYSYQWERCDSLGEDCSAISGQTGKNHTISDSDANHTLRAKVTAENSVGSAVAYSATSDLVVNPPVNQSLPLITGIIRVGQTLTGTAGGWSNSPYGYAYQWQRCSEDLGCRDIPGATSGTYLLQDEDTGLRIGLLVIASNSSGSAQASSEQTEQVLRMPLNTEAPSISGTSKLGETLQASEGKWTAYPAPTYAYQWQRCNSSGADCVDIDSASSSSYTLTADDVSKKLKVKVTAQNSEGQGSATSAASEIIVAPPANVALPVLSGSFKVGELVSVSDGSWSGYPTPEIEYQWRRCDGAGMSCVDINGATLASYTLVSADAGKTIRALLTATNSSGSDSVSSSASDRVTQTPASTAPPTVTGTAQVGSTLSSSDGLWEAYPEVSFSYQWQVSSNGTSGWTNATGPGATSVSYTIPSADAGKYLKIKITAENSAGSASAYSAVSSQVTMIPAPVSPPVITGSAVTGSTLNASSGSWDGFPSPAYSYQWQVSSDGSSGWTSAAGAGNGTNTYIIPTADAGKYLRVQVAATNSVGSETAYSAASGLVLDKPTNTVLPTMSGTMITGSVAAATSGSWTGTPAPTYSYLWQVSTDGSTGWTTASGSGYNTASYTIGNYTGKYLRVQVTATNSADSVVAYSASDRVLGIACSSAPVVSGTARTSLTLSSSAPDCSGSYPAVSVAYQWQVSSNGSTSWASATGTGNDTASYTIPTSDAGKYLRVKATATNSAGSVQVYSTSTSSVIDRPVNTVLPAMSGSMIYNTTQAASSGSWTGTPAPSYTYQWQISDDGSTSWTSALGAGNNTASYTIGNYASYLGKYLRVEVTAANTAGSVSAYSSSSRIIGLNNSSLPTVTGLAQVGKVLSSSSGDWSSSYPTPAYTYQWQVSNNGSTSWTSATGTGNDTASYTVVSADVGKYLRVQVTATNSAGSDIAHSASTDSVTAAPVNTSLPSLSGTTTDGQTLTASSGSWTGSPTPTYTYQWQVASAATGATWTSATGAGATTTDYVIAVSDVGKYLRVQVTATNSADSVIANSSASAAIAASIVVPANTVLPVVSGTASAGQTLTASSGTWTGRPTPTYAYQWQVSANGTDGWTSATGTGNSTSSYTISEVDAGKYLRVQVTATNSVGSADAASVATLSITAAPVNTVAPAVSGAANAGSALTASSGSWTGTPTPTYAYQWQVSANGTTGWTSASGTGNTTASYTVATADAGKYLRVQVTATNSVSPVTAVSAATAAVTAAPANTALPSVSGAAVAGSALTASSGSWVGFPTPTYAYQWQVSANGTDGWTSATGTGNATSAYTVAIADAGNYLRIQVTASNGIGSPATAHSQAFVIPTPPVNTVLPVVTGTTTPGSTLTATTGTWTGNPAPTYSYQWQRCDLLGSRCTNVGTNSSSYTLVNADAAYTIKVQVTASNVAGSVAASSTATSVIASSAGCTLTTSGGYTIHTCTTVGSSTINTYRTLSADYLVVGGGGGGGFNHGAGGGAGGMRTGSLTATTGLKTVTIAAGGGGSTLETSQGSDGGASVFDTITSTGGGGGGTSGGARNGRPGGSGGGASGGGGAIGTGTAGQGNNGGSGSVTDGVPRSGGGGGGAGAVGANGVDNQSGAGGAGLSSSITGTATFYAGGGGGGSYNGTNSSGGVGGGGRGSSGTTAIAGLGATANTGGGGGAGSAGGGSGGSGGSGVVVVRYKTAAAPANTVLPTISSANGVVTGTNGTWTGEPAPTYTYQWQVASAATGATWSSATGAGATSLNYTPASADIGQYLRLTVTGTSTSGVATASSAASGQIATPANTAVPTISGTTTPGQTLTAAAGTWTGTPTTYAYQWQRCDLQGNRCTNVGTNSSTYTLVNADATYTIKVQVTGSNVAGSASASSVITSAVASASGCTVTTSGGYTIHSCTTTGSSTINTYRTLSAEYLVVAGGGGGGNGNGSGHEGGGGGAGGLAQGVSSVASGSYIVTVGSGGGANSQGGGSSALGVSTTGGGAGAAGGSGGGAGGSGGGGSNSMTAGGAGIAGQGYAGGTPNYCCQGGGGGGAGETGNTDGQGFGGDGIQSSVTGTPIWYAGGGSATSYNSSGVRGFGAAGDGGGGAVSTTANVTSGSSAANTGGGGGGGYWSTGASAGGGSGGSGVAIVRYKTAAAPANTVLPTVPSSPNKGVPLTGAAGTWTGEPAPALTYQWQVAAAATGATWTSATGTGATSLNYTVASADVDKYLRLTVTGTSTSGVTTASSAVSSMVTDKPINTVLPVISGAGTSGSVLNVSSGTWTGAAPIAYSYQWQISNDGSTGWANASGSGSTSSAYAVAAGDGGKYLRVTVGALNSYGSGSPVTTTSFQAPVSPANTVAPVIAGTLTPGSTLTASTGTWTGPPTAYSYQWQRCDLNGLQCTNVGTNSASYTLVSADAAYTSKVQVAASNAAGSASASSAATSAIASASGCTITTSGGYTIHSCTTTGSSTINTYRTLSADYLVVAGGGSGGAGCQGGGGGAGGYLAGSAALPSGSHSVSVGTGGVSALSGGSNGLNSSFRDIQSVGGGRGAGEWAGCSFGGSNAAATSGGSGGGGSHPVSCTGSICASQGSGTAGQGSSGGSGWTGSPYAGGGGGGAGGVGQAAGSTGGSGGVGRQSSITGVATYYAGGGGGSDRNVSRPAGGLGGGGDSGAIYAIGTAGAPNTGGGGGAGNITTLGSNGGSGIVVIRYKTAAAPANTVLPTISSANGVMTGDVGTWTGEPAPTYTYQWQVASAATGATWTSATGAGATTSSYTPASADIGQYLRLTVTGTSTSGVATASSAASGQIATPANTAVPTISGTTTPGQTLTAAAGTWTGTPTTYAYQWQRCDLSGNRCTDIGTNSSTYTLVNADATYTIKVQVTGSNVAGSAAASSAITSAVASASGCTITASGGYTIHSCTTVGSNTLNAYRSLAVEYLTVGGGGGGGMDMGGGGGGGGVLSGATSIAAGATAITVGAGGTGGPAGCSGAQPCVHQFTQSATNGGSSVFGSTTTVPGGGFGGSSYWGYTPNYGYGGSGASGGGVSGYSDGTVRASGAAATAGWGYAGGGSPGQYYAGGGGGAGGAGTYGSAVPSGGIGVPNSILGTQYYWGGGGGGSAHSSSPGGSGGLGGGGGGAIGVSSGGAGLNPGSPGGGGASNSQANAPGGNGGANTGGGGGGGSHYNYTNQGGKGGSGIVIVRYKTAAAPANTALPTISGANGVMTGTNGTWTGEPAPTYTYQWQVASAATGATWSSATGAGATTSSYTPAAADIGKYLRLTVTGTSTSGVATASSAASGQIATPANTAVPTISGTTTPGQTLTAAAGTWTGTPTTYAYQWQRCDLSGNRCTDIGTNSSTYTLVNADATYTIKVQVTGSNVAGSAAASSALTSAIASASGCTVTTSGLYTIHSCTTTGSSTINTYRSLSTDYLVIGGGGGGGGYVGGGGGAGGFVEGSQSLIAGSYPITVGAGGANEVSGGNSTGFSKTALGGGAGSRFPNNAGVAGGSGGGAGGPEGGLPAGGAATQPSSASGGYGNRGGNVTGVRTGTPTQGMGGGGAGNNGQDASANITSSGGAGRASSITGTSYSYSGGGGGGGFYNNGGSGGSGGGGGGGSYGATGGAGGTGGTSNGSAGSNVVQGPGGAGAPNTGGGGGGTGHSEASGGGGSGVVIVRYKTAAAPVNTALPTVPGAVNNGSVLTGNAGTWTGEPTPALTYQWQVASAATGATWSSATGNGATSLSYTVASADIGQYLRLTVTGTSTSGIASASSAASSMVTDKPVNTVLPGVSGVANVGSSLTSDSGTWTGAAPISYAYQWQVQQVSSSILGTTGAAPWGIAVDSAGNVYTANIDSNSVSKITPAGVSTILGTTGDFPVAITVDSAGNVYTVNTGSQNVSKITPAGTSTILATTTGSPSAIAVDSAGNVYTANTGSSNVSKITPSGASSILGTTGTRPRAITVDVAGNVYTANTDSSNVSKITPAGVSTILGSTDFSPWGIAVDSAGNVYTTHPGPNNVSKITPAGVSITNWAATASTSYSIAADSAGNVYTANTGTNNVSKITPAGVSTVLATTGTNPRAVTVDAAGNVYTANMDSNNVSKITQWTSATGAGATTSSYVPAASDSGKTLRSQVTASNSYGSTVAYSTGTSVNVAPVNSVVPVIAGTLTPGSTLTASTGTWTGSPTPTYAYQWMRCDLQGNRCTNVGTNSSSYTLVNADASYTIKVQVTGSNVAGSASASSALTSTIASASGCTVTTSGGYTIHSCTTTGSSTINTYRTLSADYLVVGGGGSTGRYGGGGGGGGVLSGTTSITAGAKAITVGAGGTGLVGGNDTGQRGTSGGDSVFSSLTAVGGGAGGGYGNSNVGASSSAGLPGGSGGGGAPSVCSPCTMAGGAGTASQGNAGGSSQGQYGSYNGGGGGGAGQVGVAGTSTGKGGDGVSSSISGVAANYGGGGSGSQVSGILAGGSGGGGSGFAAGATGSTAVDGTANTGGGAGSPRDNSISGTVRGGNGGSGVVIVRYLTPSVPVNTSLPTISGTANKGNVLTGNAGTWTGEPTPTLTYQWQVAAAATGATWSSATGSGATSLSYTVASADAGKYLRLTVTGTSTSGVTSASSAASAMATDPPVSATVPSIAGTATVGSTLTSDSGTWTGAAPISYAYQWQVSSSGILGTTGALPFGTTIDSSGNIYTANYNANTVTKLTPAGVSSSLSYMGDFGTQPWGITVDSSGNIYTANRTSSNITKITPAGSASTFASALGSPVAITIDSNGNLYTANYDLNQVTKITPAGAATTLASTGTGPYAVAVDSAGNVYTPNYGSNNVTKITPAGVSTILGTTGTNPRGIALDAAGNVYTVNGSSNTVTKITPAGVSTTLGATGANPRDIKLDSAGNVYTANYSANTVTKITPAGVSTTMGATGTSPNSMALDSAGNVYTANSGSNNVTKIAPWTNATGPGATTSSYVPAASDAGKILRSQVTATNSYGSAIAYSPDTAAITYTPANTVPPAISPSGANLIATSGTWAGFPTPTYAYQWQVSSDGSTAWTAAAGAGSNTNTYTPAASDASKYLRVAVTGTNALGSAVASSSSLGLDRFTLPTLAWNSTPATPVATGTATATGTWTSGGGLATLQCQTGSGAWVSCDSATTHTWTLGAAGSDTVLNVRAVNSAGTSATLTRTVHRNYAAPTVSISSAPPHYYIQTGTYNYTTAGAGSCSWVLNNAPWSGSISAAGSCTAAGGAIALSAAQRGGQGWRRMTITVTNADGSASASTTNDWYSGPSEVPNGDFQTGALAPYWTDVSSSYSGTGSVSLSNSNTWQLAITSTNSTYWNAVLGGSHYNRCDNIYWESAVNNYTQANYTYVGSYYSAPSYYAGYYVASTYTAATAYAPASYSAGAYSAPSYYAGAYSAPYSYVSSYSQVRAGAAGFRLWYWGANTWNLYYDWLDYEGSNTMLSHAHGGSQFCGVNRVMTMMGRSTTSGQSGTSYFDNVRGQNAG